MKMTRQGNSIKLEWPDIFKLAFTVAAIVVPVWIRMEIAMARHDERIMSIEREVYSMKSDVKEMQTLVLRKLSEQ